MFRVLAEGFLCQNKLDGIMIARNSGKVKHHYDKMGIRKENL